MSSSKGRPSGSSSVSEIARPRTRRSRCRRGEFVEGLLNLCEREGPEAITARRLAHETRCSPMAVYRHFRSMEQLAAAAWSELHGRVNEMVWSAARQADDPVDELGIVFRGYVRFAERHPRWARFLLAAPTGDPRLPAPDEVADIFLRVGELIERGARQGAFRSDLDPRAEALRVVFLILGNATLMMSARRELVAQRRADDLLEATLQEALAGLLPRPAAAPTLS